MKMESLSRNEKEEIRSAIVFQFTYDAMCCMCFHLFCTVDIICVRLIAKSTLKRFFKLMFVACSTGVSKRHRLEKLLVDWTF